MRAAARLRVKSPYFHDPHLPLGNGRFGIQRPERIGGLTAPAGVKAGLIEGDGVIMDRDDARVAFTAMAVLQVETRGGRGWHEGAVAAGLKCFYNAV